MKQRKTTLLIATWLIAASLVIGCVDTGNDPATGEPSINESFEGNTINPELDDIPDSGNLNENELNTLPLDDINTELELETDSE